MGDAHGPLVGHTICFSGFHSNYDVDETTEQSNDPNIIREQRDFSLIRLTKLAQSLGAIVRNEVTVTTTTLIARRGLTNKRIVAERSGIPVVSPQWLQQHGCVSDSDVRVPPLKGYVFCSTQLQAAEDAALEKIITCNGGEFDRVLSAGTSMLFIPDGWLKNWEIQKRRGRASTDAAAADNKTIPHVWISEKIRFAWNADIPVVEYPRFVSMASLRVDETVNKSTSMWANGNVPASDFDTIAELCAVSMSTVCGNVLPSQMNPIFPSYVSNAGEEKEENGFDTMDVNNVEPEEACSGSQKRSREMHSIQDRSSNNNSDEREVKRFCGERIDEVVITTEAEANSACNNAVPFFTHSDPFLQLTLIGCSPRELCQCVRMSVTCRFLRTPIPTHVTDVVVVGSELDATQLAQLRDQLAWTCGVPLHRIVSTAWLEACYNRMLQLPSPTEEFCPAPLPLSLIPPTEDYLICVPSAVTSFFNVQQPQRQAQVRETKKEEEEQQQKQQKQRVATSPPQSNSRKSTVLSNRQLQKPLQEREPRGSIGNGPRDSFSIEDEMQHRHDTELRLVKLRVQELRSIIDPPNTTCSDIMPGAPLASGLFCFVNGEFSRTELAVVRALTRYGSGKFRKLTREEWTQVIRGADKRRADAPNSLADDNALVRRCSVRRRQFLLNGSTSVSDDPRGYTRRSSGEATATATATVFALRVIPHGDQRSPESFLRQPPLPPPSRAQQQQQQQRDPLRYLTAVTMDYILCSLAAGKLLDPRGCFLFTRAMPIEAESRWRSLQRAAAGRPLRQSLWCTSRRSENAPIMGVSLFFLCTEHPNGAALQRALTHSLATAVMNLGGSVAETLRDDVVTHCVVLDVAGMIDAGALDAYTATTFPHHAHIRSRVSQVDDLDRTNNTNNTNEEETEDTPYEALLAARTGPIPLSYDIQSRLPYQSIQNARVWASAGRLAIVGLDWLEACLAWGVFLDEAAFALIPARGEESPRAVSASRAFVTPPPTPGQNREGDFTLLGSEPSGLHVGSSTRVATHFNFTSPMPTPGRECAFQGSRATSTLRQSCPRSTLRTPRRHCISAPRVVSPALGIPYHSPTHEMRHTHAPTHDVVPEGIHSPVIKTPDHPSSFAGASSSLRATDERVATSGSPTHDGNGAYTPIRSTQQQQLLLGGDHMSDCSVTERRSTVRRSTTAPPPAALVPQWDPVAGNGIDGRHSTSIGPLPRLSQAWAAGRDVRDQVKLAALRLHVVSDVPEREQLLQACVQLSESVNSSLTDGSLGKDQSDAMALGRQQGQLLLHRNTTTSIAAGFSRVEFMTPAVRDADVVVVHELTQRESILAAIAAGLWVITPKALHECCEKQCLLPLRNLALYEWCPEWLHPKTPDRIVQLARQCGQRRRQRQANGKKLFDDQCFLLIAANAGVARVLSLRTVIETGGGSVVAVVLLNSNKCPTGKDESSSDKNNSIQGGRGASLCHRSSDPFVSNVREMDSTEAVMQFTVSLIKGSERVVNGADDASSDGGFSTSHCWGASSRAKELLVLLDGEFDMDGTNAAVLREITESFQKGKSELIQAKRHSLGKQQERKKKFLHWHAVSIGDEEDVGMPHLEMLRLFTSEWLTLTIQDKQKAPECVVELH